MRSRKGDVGLGVIVILVIILVFIIWIVGYTQKECKSNEHCEKDSYCGSDFSCHKYPTIVQEKVVEKGDYSLAAFLLGLSIVVAAIILRGRPTFGNGQGSPPHHQGHEQRDKELASSQHFEHYGEQPPSHGPPKHH